MTVIWLGVLLVFGGMLHLAFQPIWRGRLSGSSPRPTQRHPGTYETGCRFWDQIELARYRAGRAWRRFLAGRGCHLNSKPTSLTRLDVARA